MRCSRYRLAIGDSDAAVREALASSLAIAGHQVVVSALDGQTLVEGCVQTIPDLVIAEMRLGDMEGATAAALVHQHHDIPFIFSSACFDKQVTGQAGGGLAYSYLMKPLRHEVIEPLVQLAVAQHRQVGSLRTAVTIARQQLADRKLIERAKGLLMIRNKLSEQEAFSQIKRAARNGRQEMAMVARSLLLAEDLLRTT